MTKQFFTATVLLLFALIPGISTAQKEAIKTLIENQKFKEAAPLIEKELYKTTNDADLYFYKYMVLRYRDKDLKGAFAWLNKALEIDQKASAVYAERGLLYMEMLMFEDAREDFELGIKYAPTDSLLNHARLRLGWYYYSIQEHDKTIEILNTVLENDSASVGALNNLALAYQGKKDYDKALEILYRLDKIEPDALVLVNIGFTLNQKGDYKNAIDYFNKAEKVEKIPLVYSNRAFAEFKLQNLGPAMVDINRSIKLYPSNSYAYWIRAQIYLEQKQTDKACEDLEQALALKFTEMYGDDVKTLRNKNCIK